MRRERSLTDRQKKWIAGTGVFLFLVLSALVCWFAGRPLIRFVREPERFQAWVDAQGVRAPLLFVGMVVLQIVVAIIPGEPLEIAAGYAFGALEGTLLCLIGALVGRVAVFLLVRRFGVRAVEVFFLFFLPGTPKDVLCYIVGLTKLPLRSWIIISTIAPIPSIITSTIGGSALGMGRYTFAAAVFGATLAISAAGLLVYRRVSRRNET